MPSGDLERDFWQIEGGWRARLAAARHFLTGSRLPHPANLALMAAVMLGLNLACIATIVQNGGYTPVMGAVGVYLGAMIIARPDHVLAYWVIGALSIAIWSAPPGIPLAGVALIALSKTIAVSLAGLLLRRRLGRSTDLSRPGMMWSFAVIGLIALPVLPGITIALVRHLTLGTPILDIFISSHLANALGCAIFTPLVLSIYRDELRAALDAGRRVGNLLTLFGLCAATMGLFLQHSYPLAYMELPLMLVVVLRLGMVGASIGTAIVATITIAMTLLGQSRFAIVGADPATKTMLLQLFVATICAQSYPLAVLVLQRRALELGLVVRETRARFAEAKLRRSESLHRALSENASDIVSRFSIEGNRLYVSPSVTDILGYQPQDLVNADPLGRVHPDDRENFLHVRDQMRDAAEKIEVSYRFSRADGGWAWLESRLRLVRNAAGQPSEYVSNARDVTRQKQTEAQLADAMSELSVLATTDGLTGLANRRRFDETLRKEWRRAMRSETPLSLIMLDADHFKLYNDTYGHQEGDACLRALATAFVSCIKRPGDVAARYGGEEFAVILPGADADGVAQVAERMRQTVLQLSRPHISSASGVVTVSIGIATAIPERNSRAEALVAEADAALYVAKRRGRNRVVSFGPDCQADSEPTEMATEGMVMHLHETQRRDIA
jgi:diguanylate cyclase (GGDEF)-like protein/PAS domain S-box-containing protein